MRDARRQRRGQLRPLRPRLPARAALSRRSLPMRPRRAGAIAVGTLALALGAAACQPRPEPGREGQETHPIEMFSWWEGVGDADALRALMTEHGRQHPADTVINASSGLSGLARKTLRNRMLSNEPPDTFQANAGRDLMQWVLTNGMDGRESKLLPLDDLVPGAAAWRD